MWFYVCSVFFSSLLYPVLLMYDTRMSLDIVVVDFFSCILYLFRTIYWRKKREKKKETQKEERDSYFIQWRTYSILYSGCMSNTYICIHVTKLSTGVSSISFLIFFSSSFSFFFLFTIRTSDG